MASQMAMAALAHVFVFSAEQYHYIPASEHGKVTAKTSKEEIAVKGSREEPAIIEKKDALVEAPGTSVRESVQDIVVQGGQRVSLPKSCIIEVLCLQLVLFVIM